ncbi:MAG: AAA family ATPase [Brevefilum sp.]
MRCPNCEYDNPPGTRFCGKCGSRIAKSCPACGALNPLEFKFCGQCGNALAEPANRFGRQEPSATYSFFPASSSAFVVNPVTEHEQLPKSVSMLRGERRVATVIVADVKKSTELLSEMDSETWVDLMSSLLQMMEAQIYRYGGQVDQFRGDGLVAFFGARDAHEDDPERAILAALAMQEGFERYKNEFKKLNTKEIKLRVGINTDELIVAQVGTRGMHREDTAMGEAIALAARLEAAAEPGTVLVSETTYNLVSEKFHWIDLGETSLKGFNIPVHVYRPLALRSDAELLQEMQTYIHSTPLIGRYEEYELIRQKVDQMLKGRGELVHVTGERGLGKSFLVRQVQKDLHLRKQLWNSFEEVIHSEAQDNSESSEKALWLRGWCSSYEQPTPFYMWRILLTSWLDISPEENDQDILARLRTYCDALWADDSKEFLPMLTSVLGIAKETFEDQLQSLDAQGYQGKLFFTFKAWLTALTRKTPLILHFGSLHWANTTSIELLRDVISLSEDHPILWFLIYRPDRQTPTWHFQHFVETEYPHRMTMITLQPFTREESKALIEYILKPDHIDHETLKIIVNRTEGNPYFIHELINNLIQEGTLVKEKQSNIWHLTSDITTSDLPESLHSLFLSRIDKLSQPDRLILQIASVVGFVFWDAIIEEIAPNDIEVSDSLNNLQKANLIEERGSFIELGAAYNFTSTLVKDVTYESILNSQRIELHAKIGDFLQDFELNQEVSSQFLAHHFMMAGNLRLELLYRIRAAEQARDIFANQEAYHEFSRALEILDQLEEKEGKSQAVLTERFELVKGRIEILYNLGRVVEAHEESRKLLEIADEIEGDPTWRIDALLIQPGVKYVQNQEMLQEGIPQAEEALRLAQEIDDPYREMESLAAVAGHRFLQNDPNWKEFGHQAIAISQELGDKKIQVQLLLGLAGAYGMDKLEEGLKLVKQAQPIAEDIDYKGAQVELLYWLGTELEREGDYYRLLKDFEERRLELARELGWRLVEARSLMFIGQIKGIYLGDCENALHELNRAEELWQDTDQRLFVYLRQAQIYANMDDYDQTRHYLSLAKPLSEAFVQSLAKVGWELVNAIMYLRIGHLDNLMRVLEHADQVLHIVEEENLVSRQYRMAAACKAAQAQLRIAKIMQQNDDIGGYEYYRKKAIESSGLALDTYNDFGFTQIIECVSEEILYYHGLSLKENGQIEEGEDYIRKAHAEVIRKFKFIPEGSTYRKTFMDTTLHQAILDEGKKF